MVSDLYDPAGFERGLDLLRHHRYEPHIVQIYDRREAEPALLGDMELLRHGKRVGTKGDGDRAKPAAVPQDLLGLSGVDPALLQQLRPRLHADADGDPLRRVDSEDDARSGDGAIGAGASPMNFANPSSLLWAGLAVPIVIFYILKIRLRRVPVSTILFWQQIFEEKQPRAHLAAAAAPALPVGAARVPVLAGPGAGRAVLQ